MKARNKAGSSTWLLTGMVVLCGACLARPAAAQQPAASGGATNAVTAAENPFTAPLAAIQETLNATDGAGKPLVESSQKQYILQALARVERAIEQEDYRSASQLCDNMLSYSPSTALRKAVKELTSALTSQARAGQTALVKDAQALLKDLFPACARAKTPDELQALYARIQETQNALSRVSSDSLSIDVNTLRNNLSMAQDIVRQWSACLAAEAAGDTPKAMQALNQIQDRASNLGLITVPEVTQKMDRLQGAVQAEIEKTLKTVRDGLAKATTSREVQTLAMDFNRRYEQLRRATGNDSVTQQSIENMRSALEYWTRLVAAEETANIASAMQMLASIEENLRMDPALQALATAKRDALIARLLDKPERPDDPFLRVVDEQMAKVDSVEKLLELRRRLTPLQYSFGRRSESGQTEIQSLLADIQILEASYNALQARQFGLSSPFQYGGVGVYPHRWKVVTTRYHNQIRVKVLAEMFELKDLQIGEGQTIDQALLQKAEKAKAAKEWAVLARSLDAYRASVFGMQQAPAALADEINACRSFIAARNFEQAGEVERAAASYLAVLTAPSGRAPVEEAIQEIARLRKANPELFEKLRSVPVSTPAAIAPVPAAATVAR